MKTSTVIRIIVNLGILILLLPCARSIDEDDKEETDLGEVIQYVDGDIFIAVFAPITNRGEDMECTRRFVYPGIAEQVNMFLEKINSNPSILPGIKLGAIVINSCNSQVHSLQKLQENIILPDVYGRNFNRSFSQKKIILAGVLGGVRSDVSMSLASLLNVFRISQVSYWSTSSMLSDKSQYEYFFRTVPSDIFQAQATADFIEKRGWNYVSIVYNKDAYGVGGFKVLSKILKQKGICIAESLSLSIHSDKADARRILNALVKNERAKAVISFACRTSVSILMSTAMERQEWKDIAWIASDGWAESLPEDGDISYLDAVDGTIGFSIKFPSMERLNERIRNLTIRDYRGEHAILNPWWQDYLKFAKNCTTEKGSDMRQCDEDERIPHFEAYPNNVDVGMYVFANAAEDMRQETCPAGSKGVCDEMWSKAQTVAVPWRTVARVPKQYIENVSFIAPDNTRFEFDSFQDGPPRYDIVVFNKNKAKPGNIVGGWQKVGTYDKIRGISLSKQLPDKVLTLKSVCSDKCGPGYVTISFNEVCCWVCQKCVGREYATENSCQKCENDEMPISNNTACTKIPITEMLSSGNAALCVFIGVLGLVCTMTIIGMYWKYRSSAIIIASARELGIVILGGVGLTLLNCITIVVPPSTISCGLMRVILAVGPSLIYNGLLMKAYRVFFLFQRDGTLPSRKKKYFEPGPLVMLTICVTLVQVVVLVGWLAQHPPEVDVFYSTTGYHAVRACKHLVGGEVYVGLAYPFVIIIICTVLATINRNVPTGFRETLFIGFVMYLTCVALIGFTVAFFADFNDQKIERQLAALSCGLSVSAIAVLFGLFVPKFYTIFRRPVLNTLVMVMSKLGKDLCDEDRGNQHGPIETEGVAVFNNMELPKLINRKFGKQ